jgi:hypothetical protein
MKLTTTILLILSTQLWAQDRLPFGFNGAFGDGMGFERKKVSTISFNSFSITDSTGSTITMAWSTSTNADSVVILRGSFGGALSRLTSSTSPYINSSLTYATGYTYQAIAFKGSKSVTTVRDSATTWTWSYSMMISYAAINAPYGTYTQAQKDTIVNIFSIQSVKDTFYTKYAKTTADFIMIFFNSNKTTELIARTNTNSGRTLRWTFGRKTYDKWDQNDLPSDTCKNGWVFVTKVGGFSGWTVLGLNVNTFISLCPIGSLPAGLTSLSLYSNQFTGNWTDKVLPAGLTSLYLNTNQFTGNWTDKVLPAGLTSLSLYSNQFTGNWTDKVLPAGLISLYLNENQFTGSPPNITPHATNGLIYKAYSNGFTSASNVTTFRKAMTDFRLDGNALPTAKVDELLHNMVIYYTANAPTVDCIINLSGATMGIPTGGASNTDLVALQGIWTTAGKTLTITVRTS